MGWEWEDKSIMEWTEILFKWVTTRHSKKFGYLAWIYHWKQKTDCSQVVVINLSSKPLDSITETILSKDFAFAVTPKLLPVKEFKLLRCCLRLRQSRSGIKHARFS